MQNSHVREALSFGFPSKNHSKKDMSKVYNYVVVKKWSLKKKNKTLESVNKDKSMQSKNKVMSYHEEFFFTLFLFFLI